MFSSTPFGTSALGEIDGIPTIHRYVPIVHKNNPIPVTKSEVFYTLHDNQKAVDVKIYQGEDPDALNNIQIGEFFIEGLSKAPAGNPIVMRLSLDLDGVLNVSAMEKNTGLEKSITIDNAFRRYEKEEVAQAQARINALFDEEEAIEEAELLEEDASAAQAQHILVQARAVVEKAERMLEEAAAEDREDMVNLIETIQDAMTAKDMPVLREAMDELSDILYYLES
jgi:molecular chaperone DnaK (HSP70)